MLLFNYSYPILFSYIYNAYSRSYHPYKIALKRISQYGNVNMNHHIKDVKLNVKKPFVSNVVWSVIAKLTQLLRE